VTESAAKDEDGGDKDDDEDNDSEGDDGDKSDPNNSIERQWREVSI